MTQHYSQKCCILLRLSICVWPHTGQKALHTCTCLCAYAAMFGSSIQLGWGKIGLRPRGVTDVHFPNPPPLLARRDGAMTTGIHSPPVPPLPPTVVVFMSGLFRLHPIARGGGGGATPHHGHLCSRKGVLSSPPQLGKKVKPACPGTQPSDSTCLTQKGWFAKKEKKILQSGAVSGPLCLTDFCLFPCQGLVASGKGSRAGGGGGLRGMCACD